MKVNIGKYRSTLTVYSITGLYRHLGVSEHKIDALSNWLDQVVWIRKLLEYINRKRERKIKVRIDNHDLWSMYDTLAHIITPMLVQLKEVKHGSPLVDFEDVPEDIRTLDIHQRWEWVMDEMIWTFKAIQADDDGYMSSLVHRRRVEHGLALFGKYYLSLWD